MEDSNHFDYLIIGAGIIGLTVARELKSRDSANKICIIEKEDDVARHSSGRNSRYTWFYYTEDSLRPNSLEMGTLR